LPVRLRVLKVNPRALAFYRRLGFTCTGETETHDLMEWSGTQTASFSKGACDG
jgi:RimJ/RimL family protein N-acetyltransferase